MVGITVEEVIKHAHKKFNSLAWSYESYKDYKLKCLSSTMDIPVTSEMFVHGEFLIYAYCGHDSTAYIGKLPNKETLEKSLAFYNDSRYFYFEAFGVIDGVIQEN